MATIPNHASPGVASPVIVRLPPLENGDRLTRTEFERRYAAMPGVKAELVEGIVVMPSPVTDAHGSPHFDLITWLGLYRAMTPGISGADNATVRLDPDNELQPDALLRRLPEFGGRTKVSESGFIEGAPELVAEIAVSSASYDLHSKLNVYRRNRVEEYVVWRVWDGAIDWFVLHDERYEPLESKDGIYRSPRLAGLWLDAAAMLQGDLAKVMSVLQQGLASPEHAGFIERMQTKRSGT